MGAWCALLRFMYVFTSGAFSRGFQESVHLNP